MSKLLEHEVKTILAGERIRVPNGVLVSSGVEAAGAAIDFEGPYYVKAQIAAGDRAAAGGIVRVADAGAARAAAADMFGREIRGQTVNGVLIEQGASFAWEGYAAVSIAENPPRRVLFFSRRGGAGFDPATAEFQLSLRHDDPQIYRIRRELRRIGVETAELEEITAFLGCLARAAIRWCTYTLEVNPVVMCEGAMVALDAKADIDDYSKSLIPTPTLLDRPEQDPRERAARDFQQSDHRGSLRYVQLIGEAEARPGAAAYLVASHSVGGGESMVVLDALATCGLAATNYCDTSGSPSEEKVAAAARLVCGQGHVDGLLFSTCIANQALSVTAKGLVMGWEAVNWRGPTVVRFAGNQSEEARSIVRAWLDRNGVRNVIVGEETDEWQAAAHLRTLLDNTRSQAA
jgi:succinyl-CoA synthetase beta subunit